MKRNKKTWLISGALLVIIFTAITYIVGGMVFAGSVGDQPVVAAEAMTVFYTEREDQVLAELSKYKSETIFIESPENGYSIETLSIKANEESHDAMIIVHGITSNYHEVLNSAFNYLENGMNVVVYHQRQTGLTGGEYFTFGLYERFDLEEVAKYTRELYPTGKIGIHGFSMGAATSTMHTALNEKSKFVDFYILDAPYHTMASAIDLGIMNENIPLLPVSYARFAGDLMTQLLAGFSYKDVQPVNHVREISVPVMLIHGTSDNITSPLSSQEIYDAIPHDNKKIWLIDGLGHCEADDLMETEYFNTIFDFIDTYVK